MGVCGSNQKEIEEMRKNKNKNTNIINNSNTQKNITNKKKEEEILILKQDYILSSNIVKRDDITKYYKISSKILGNGTTGFVYIGENEKGKFAIKRINKDKLTDIESIKQEVKYSKLNHENIIKYYEIFEDLKTISFVMELCDGDLFDFVLNTPEQKLSIDLCIEITIQILKVIKFLHYEKNIIHRDLKPENFMINIGENNYPIVKLIDFGFAENIPKDKLLFEIVGTLDYSAPEVISHFGYNEKMDIWSIGIIIFNMLTGLEPFKSDNTSTLIDEIKFKKINFNLIEDEKMRNLVMKMLERNCRKRINANEAYDIIMNIKKERDLEYEKEINDQIIKMEKIKQQKMDYENYMNPYINNLY